jgi:hypothetical protein
MASPPPPYANITGISRTVMKDNAQETIANYDGNARPGEMVVNLLNNDVYIGNVNGGLNLISSGSGYGVFNTITANSGIINGNLVIVGNISAATTTKIGGVRAGPGANISNTGLLTIDTAGLSFSFGNFYASNNILSIVNSDENMILATNGNAEVQLIGNVGFYKIDGLPPSIANRYAYFTEDGQVTFRVPTVDFAGAVQIIGSTTGNSIAPGITGAMLHITGQLDVPCRTYTDGNSDYVAWVARRYNGNVATPTQVLANEDVLRINATAATDAGVGNVAMAQIQFRALENQTTTAQGSVLNFIVTPVGNTAANRVEVANITVANGVAATKFTTAGTVSAAGNITGSYIFGNGTLLTGVSTVPDRLVLNSTKSLVNQTELQSLLGQSLTVNSATRYSYSVTGMVYKANTAATVLQYALGGTANITQHNYATLCSSATIPNNPGYVPVMMSDRKTSNIGVAANISSSSSGQTYYNFTITGTIDITTGGTLTPQIGFTTLPTSPTTAIGTAITVTPIGNITGNTVVGPWA